jgi:hypothetical protein
MVHAAFTMDDGSTLNLQGTLTDLTERHIDTFLVLAAAGKCSIKGDVLYFFTLPGLDRQS